MSKSLDADVQLSVIYKDHEIRTHDKIKKMIIIKPSLTTKDIAELLEMSIRGVQRHLKNI
jgi:DNA-binding CsgD family transcriptional regulator